MIRKIKLWGSEYWLIGDKDGAIATPDQYKNFECSYAHLFPNGEIKRFKKVIGSIQDIEFIEVIEQ